MVRHSMTLAEAAAWEPEAVVTEASTIPMEPRLYRQRNVDVHDAADGHGLAEATAGNVHPRRSRRATWRTLAWSGRLSIAYGTTARRGTVGTPVGSN